MNASKMLQKIDVFISSPGDVGPERRAALRVIERLNRLKNISSRYVLRPLYYEDLVPAAVGERPLATVDHYMMQAEYSDLFICILWRRIGTPVVNEETGKRYESGTEYEFMSAYHANQQHGKPYILLYRCTRPEPSSLPVTKSKRRRLIELLVGQTDEKIHQTAPSPNEIQQLARVEAFFQRFEGEDAEIKGIYKRFESERQFEDSLFHDIDAVLTENLIVPDEEDLLSPAEVAPLLKRTGRRLSSGSQSRFRASVERDRDSYLIRYRQDVGDRLKQYSSAWVDRFIDLPLSTFPVKVRAMNVPWRSGVEGESAVDFGKALRDFGSELIAILGEPGAGKTTLLQQRALAYLEGGPKVPIFVELSNFQDESTVQDLILTELVASGMTLEVAFQLFELGGFLVLLDGLNEVGKDLVAKVARETVTLYRLHKSRNQFAITCRTAEWPAFLDRDCRRLEVLSVTAEDAVAYLAASLSVSVATAHDVYWELDWSIREFTHTPLVLNMLASVLQRLASDGDTNEFWASTSWSSKLPQNRAELYKQFIDDMMARDLDEGKATIPTTLHDQALMRLARYMNNELLSLSHSQASELIAEFYRSVQVTGARYEHSIDNVLTDVMYTPPMITSKGSVGKFSHITFMHQSFQEFYTALDMHQRLREPVEGSSLTLADLDSYIRIDDKRWWETIILLSGIESDATPLIEHIISRKNLYLAARCIRDSKKVSQDLVDRLIVYGLDSFKYDANFDYDMIYCFSMVFHRGSTNLPKRLLEDIGWWLKKYVRGVPRELQHLTDSQLLNGLNAKDDAFLVDVVWTVGQRRLQSATSALLKLLSTTPNSVREQIIAALGRIADPMAKESLLHVAFDVQEKPWLRALALNSLGQLKDPSLIPALTEYLLDPTNPYRDSAAWALRAINHPNSKRALLDTMHMNDEDVDEFSGRRYTLGTTLWALGDLGDASVVPDIVEWAEHVDDPFIIEDIVYALGQLGDPSSLPYITSQLQNTDAVVRKRAVDALVKLHAVSSMDSIQHLSNDPSPFVREAVEQALRQLERE